MNFSFFKKMNDQPPVPLIGGDQDNIQPNPALTGFGPSPQGLNRDIGPPPRIDDEDTIPGGQTDGRGRYLGPPISDGGDTNSITSGLTGPDNQGLNRDIGPPPRPSGDGNSSGGPLPKPDDWPDTRDIPGGSPGPTPGAGSSNNDVTGMKDLSLGPPASIGGGQRGGLPIPGMTLPGPDGPPDRIPGGSTIGDGINTNSFGVNIEEEPGVHPHG